MYFSCGWKAHSHTYTYHIHNTYAHENQLTVFNLSCGNILISFFLFCGRLCVCVFVCVGVWVWAILLLWGKTAQASPNHLAQAYFPLHFPGTRFTYYIHIYSILFYLHKAKKKNRSNNFVSAIKVCVWNAWRAAAKVHLPQWQRKVQKGGAEKKAGRKRVESWPVVELINWDLRDTAACRVGTYAL